MNFWPQRPGPWNWEPFGPWAEDATFPMENPRHLGDSKKRIYAGWWFQRWLLFSIIYEMSSFPLTFIFFKMVIAPPTSIFWIFGVPEASPSILTVTGHHSSHQTVVKTEVFCRRCCKEHQPGGCPENRRGPVSFLVMGWVKNPMGLWKSVPLECLKWWSVRKSQLINYPHRNPYGNPQKSRWFILIYPGGNCARSLSLVLDAGFKDFSPWAASNGWTLVVVLGVGEDQL